MATTVVVNMSTCEIILTYPTDSPDPPKIPIVYDAQLFVTEMNEDPSTLEAFLDEDGGVKFRVILS
jgi:hypothetical protein